MQANGARRAGAPRKHHPGPDGRFHCPVPDCKTSFARHDDCMVHLRRQHVPKPTSPTKRPRSPSGDAGCAEVHARAARHRHAANCGHVVSGLTDGEIGFVEKLDKTSLPPLPACMTALAVPEDTACGHRVIRHGDHWDHVVDRAVCHVHDNGSVQVVDDVMVIANGGSDERPSEGEHVHGIGCGHDLVLHDDHFDFLGDNGILYHPIDNSGAFIPHTL